MKLLIVFTLLFISGSYAFFKLAGPYEIILEGMTDCENVGSGLIRHNFRPRKVNGTTRLLQGRAVFQIPFGENITYDVKTAVWSAGGWGKNAYTLTGKDFCTLFKEALYEIFFNIYNAWGVPPECPIPAGVYEIKDGVQQSYTKLKKFPILNYGRFRTEITYFLGKEVVGCEVITHRSEEIAG